jgi:sulfur-oxidizing protein SoxZ
LPGRKLEDGRKNPDPGECKEGRGRRGPRYRHDDVGHLIKRNVINVLTCRYNGVEVFRADLSSGIAANPYVQFYTVADQSGELEFYWIDDEGRQGSERQSIRVT